MKGLSKSRYTAFCQCPKILWLKVYKPEEAPVDEALQARFEQGNKVGDLALKLFGDYKEADAWDAVFIIQKPAEQLKVRRAIGISSRILTFLLPCGRACFRSVELMQASLYFRLLAAIFSAGRSTMRLC